MAFRLHTCRSMKLAGAQSPILDLPRPEVNWAAILRLLLVATLVFNVIDAFLTIALVVEGLAVEANPFMRAALDHGPGVFFLAKMSIVCHGLGTLWTFRERTLAWVGAAITFAAYLALMVYHVQSVQMLAAHLL